MVKSFPDKQQYEKWLLAAKFPTSSIHSNTIILKLKCLPTFFLDYVWRSSIFPFQPLKTTWSIGSLTRRAPWSSSRRLLLNITWWRGKEKNIVCNSTASNIFVQILPQCSKNHIHSPCLESKEPCNKSVNTANHICWLWVRALTGKNWNESSKHKIPELHQSYLSSLHITVNSSGSQKTPSWIWSVKKRIPCW